MKASSSNTKRSDISTDCVFVYGTLKRSANYPEHDLLSPATFLGSGTFRGRLYDLGSYPGAVPSAAKKDLVYGEVYRLHDPHATLELLDCYEGCTEPDPQPEYARVIVNIRLEGVRTVPAHIYVYQREITGLRRIESGDYLAAASD